jgi:micrococcal nuclease
MRPIIPLVVLLSIALVELSSGETMDGRRAVIIDDDTVVFGSERVRILNIDTPETRGSHCERELVAGLKAKERLAEILRAGPMEVEREGKDRYRRTLTRLSVNGRDVGALLIREGLALPWQDGAEAKETRRRHWCGK